MIKHSLIAKIMILNKITILKIQISNISISFILEEIEEWLRKGQKKYKIFTPNPEIIVLAQKDKTFQEILNSADLSLPDGAGIIWAGKLLGQPFLERVSGVDFMKRLCGFCASKGFTIGLIGGKKMIALKTAECLKKSYPGLNIILAEHWDPDISTQRIIEARRNKRQIDVLFVAYGQGKQERWIADNLEKIPVKMAMGVGGAFDYISGQVPRAPKLMRNLGFEWLFRLIRQPWRIKRQLIGGQFFLLVLREWARRQTVSIVH